MPAIINVKGGLAEFRKVIYGPANADKLKVVHFWADWANQCAPMDEAINILAGEKELANVLFVRVEAEEEAEVAMEFEVAAVPTFLFFGISKQAGSTRLLERVEGAKVAEITKKVKDLSGKVALIAKTQAKIVPDKTEDINVRLKKLINAAPAMLFMKGSPAAPECGFSRTTIAMLEELNAEYGYFDILRDNEVRQGLKTYSNWPTYPQLYVNGELLGGLDILKELNESGELRDLLPQKENLNARLKKLINSAPVMVFMKGIPAAPKCGFSNTLMGILKETGVEFQTFDILEDEEVRQGLKEYSKWPTYPQVYVKGELIGGLDIVKELQEGGELIATLKG